MCLPKESWKKKSNVQNLHIAGSDKPVRFYNLDVIISIGYRVKSQQGTRFRQWATRTLREHLTQGYTLNRQRLESNARELEAALLLVKKGLPPALKPRPRTCCISSSKTTRLPMATSAAEPSCLWIFSTATAACSTAPASR